MSTICKPNSDEINIRLDVFVQQRANITRNAAQKLLENGQVVVNGAFFKANYRIRTDDMVLIEIPKPIAADILPEEIKLDIIYEDSDIIVVNKPKGMVVHPAYGHCSGTLVNALMFYCRDNLSGINGVLRPGIVHRIDKDTSGLLVAAKNDTAHNALAVQFVDHSISREYIAIVHGNVKQSGTIDAPIARHKTNRKQMAIASVLQNSKKAITHYYPIQAQSKFSLIKCTLETGRTHQIRVHMASINHPIIGDEVYSKITPPPCAKNIGQVLHAAKLGFVHPNGKYIEFSCLLPDYFTNALKKLNFFNFTY